MTSACLPVAWSTVPSLRVTLNSTIVGLGPFGAPRVSPVAAGAFRVCCWRSWRAFRTRSPAVNFGACGATSAGAATGSVFAVGFTGAGLALAVALLGWFLRSGIGLLLLLGPVGIELGVEFGGIEEIDLVERDASQHLAYLVAAGIAQLTECCATGASVNRPFPLHRVWRKASSAGIFRQRRISQSLFGHSVSGSAS